MVEMAILLPAVLLIMFALMEAGRLFFAYNTVQHAARTGARFAVTGAGLLEGDREARIEEATAEAAEVLGDVDITIRSWNGPTPVGSGRDGDAGDPCDIVEVEVQYTYRPIVSIIEPLLGEIVLVGRDRKMNEPWSPCP
jgi:Flp pilus assembly protein TadG